MTNSNLSPREYCARNHSPAFLRCQLVQQGEPVWTKIGSGLIAVTDGSLREYVAPGLVYGMELDSDGTPVIASYWTAAEPADGLGATRPYTLGSCKSMAQQGRLVIRRMPVTYYDMVRTVRSVHPLAWIPSEADFRAEFGLGR